MRVERFRQAQDAGGTYQQALAELRGGRKTTHWMWFVFPQLRGLGHSPMAVEYGIDGLKEARTYLGDPVLRQRLVECCRALLALPEGATANVVLGSVDAMKLRSSMTLFHRTDPGESAFRAVLDRYFGDEDEATLRLLGVSGATPA